MFSVIPTALIWKQTNPTEVILVSPCLLFSLHVFSSHSCFLSTSFSLPSCVLFVSNCPSTFVFAPTPPPSCDRLLFPLLQWSVDCPGPLLCFWFWMDGWTLIWGPPSGEYLSNLERVFEAVGWSLLVSFGGLIPLLTEQKHLVIKKQVSLHGLEPCQVLHLKPEQLYPTCPTQACSLLWLEWGWEAATLLCTFLWSVHTLKEPCISSFPRSLRFPWKYQPDVEVRRSDQFATEATV